MSLNNTSQQLQLKTGTVAQITAVANAMGVQGEPLYATDTKQLYIHDGTSYVSTSIFQKPVTLKGYTVATLPTGTQGDICFVTDALAPTYLTAVTGGGTIVTPVFYNGSNWVAY